MTEQQKQTAGIAITSLVLGILGLICFGPLAAIPAIICGHVAKSRIRKSGGQLEGDGFALAGLIMGYVSIALMILVLPLLAAIAIPSFVRARETTQVHVCLNNLRLVDSATSQWALENDKPQGTPIDPNHLAPYCPNQTFPSCPAGGQYMIHPVGQEAECSLHGTISNPIFPHSRQPGAFPAQE